MWDTAEQALVEAVKNAITFYTEHTHGKPFASVEISEDGVEVWTAPDGEPMLTPAQMYELAEAEGEHMRSFAEALKMPVTTL